MKNAERGFALAAALLLLVLISALVTGVLYAAAQESRVTLGERLQQQVLGFTERAVARVVASWPAQAQSLSVGQLLPLPVAADPPFEGSAFLTRLDSVLFHLVAEGRSTDPSLTGIRRRIGLTLTVRLDSSGAARPVRAGNNAWVELY